MIKELIIVGAGGFGRELLQWVKDVNRIEPKWIIKGFLDDNLNVLAGLDCDQSVIGTIDSWTPGENEVFVCAIGNPTIREKVVDKLQNRNANFATVIHPTAVVGEFNQIGIGSVVYPGSCITANVKIGNHVAILNHCSIGHDVVIEDFSTISSFCDVTGGVKVGKGAFLASSVSIVPQRTIGTGAYVGIGSVVVSNIRPMMKVMGNPAKKMDV